MALIRCPECHRDVSSKATACPNCAYPIARPSRNQRPAQVIETTGRKWKKVRVLGWLLVTVGVFALFREWTAGNSSVVAIGRWIGMAGVVCVASSRAGAWWYHG